MNGTETDNNIQDTSMSQSENVGNSNLSEEDRLKLINDTAQAVKNLSDSTKDDSKDEVQETIMLVAFNLGEEVYAVSIDQIKEVVTCPAIAPIPQVPSFVKGVANVRGNVLAILDLSMRFGLQVDGEESKFVLVMKSEELKFAISVNAVPNTMMIKSGQVIESTNIINQSTLGTSYVKGMVRHNEDIVVWVDILEMMENEDFGEV